MLKQIIALVVFSLAVILCMSYAKHAMDLLLNAHNWVSNMLMNVFSSDQAGNLVRNLLALISIPILVAFVPAVTYWIIKRNWFPYFMPVVWIVWLIQVGALMVIYNTVG